MSRCLDVAGDGKGNVAGTRMRLEQGGEEDDQETRVMGEKKEGGS